MASSSSYGSASRLKMETLPAGKLFGGQEYARFQRAYSLPSQQGKNKELPTPKSSQSDHRLLGLSGAMDILGDSKGDNYYANNDTPFP